MVGDAGRSIGHWHGHWGSQSHNHGHRRLRESHSAIGRLQKISVYTPVSRGSRIRMWNDHSGPGASPGHWPHLPTATLRGSQPNVHSFSHRNATRSFQDPGTPQLLNHSPISPRYSRLRLYPLSPSFDEKPVVRLSGVCTHMGSVHGLDLGEQARRHARVLPRPLSRG